MSYTSTVKEFTQNLESTNWLTLYPTHVQKEIDFLNEFSLLIGNLPNTKDVVLAIVSALENYEFEGRKISETEHQLLQKVYEYICLGVEKGFDEAANIKNRAVTAKEKIKKERNNSEDVLNNNGSENSDESDRFKWSYYSGEYSGPLTSELGNTSNKQKIALQPEISPTERVGDVVHFFSRRIESLLAQKRTKPIVMLDIGAMYATTWLELANKFKQEVLDGKIVFIATNVSLSYEEIKVMDRPHERETKLRPNYSELLNEAGELVHFLVCDVSDLVNMQILLPNGEELNLGEDTIDVAHECWSISIHSLILEKDITVLIDLLGTKGILMSNKKDRVRKNGGLSASEINFDIHQYADFTVGTTVKAPYNETAFNELNEMKSRGLKDDMKLRANNNLKKRGFTLFENANDPIQKKKYSLNYSFWVGKDALPLNIESPEGNQLSLDQNGQRKNRFLSILKMLVGVRDPKWYLGN